MACESCVHDQHFVTVSKEEAGEEKQGKRSPATRPIHPKDARSLISNGGSSRKYLSRAMASPGGNFWFPLPKKLKAELCYAEYGISINPGAATIATYIISANGVYDPNITGTGHQPKGFDQLMALYDHCVVTHAEIGVTFLPADTGVMCGVNVSGAGTSTYTQASDYMELPHCSWHGGHKVVTYGSLDGPHLTQSINIAKFLGVSDLLDGREFACDVTSNASEDVTFHIWAQSASGADPGAVDLVVRARYHCTFVEPRDPASS